jgi:hypothetical protein
MRGVPVVVEGVAKRIQRESKQRPEEEKNILSIFAGIFFWFVGKTRDLVLDQGLLRNDVWLWLKLKETASDIPHLACHSLSRSQTSNVSFDNPFQVTKISTIPQRC